METTKLVLSDKVEKLLKDGVSTKKERPFIKKLDTSLFDKIAKKGLLEKAEYSLPLTDTLGQSFFNATRFRAD